VEAQEDRLGKGCTESAADCTFFCGNEKAMHHVGTGFFILKANIILAVKRVWFVSDRMSSVPLIFCFYDDVLNVDNQRINVMIQRTTS
jgi:hypothetical protein